MLTSTLNSKLLVADFPDSTNRAIQSINDTVDQQSWPVTRPRNVPDLIAQHPELVANLIASLNPSPPPLSHDVALFQSAVADIQQAAVDGILTSAEVTLLIGAVIERFTARRATESVSSAVQSVFFPTAR